MRENTPIRAIFFLAGMLISVFSAAQADSYPLVHQEIHHRPIDQNDHFRLLHVFAEKGDTTDFHSHCHPILYLTLKGTEVGLQEPGGTWNHVELPDAWIGHDLYQTDSCYVHRFTVEDKKSLEILAFEALKSGNIRFADGKELYVKGGFHLFEINPEKEFVADSGISFFAVEKGNRRPKARFVTPDEIKGERDVTYYGIGFSD